MDLYDQSYQMGVVRISHFLMKMALDAATIPLVQSNLSLFTNVETLLRLNVVMPLLEAIHSLIKFAQLKDAFVISKQQRKIYEKDVYYMFYNSQLSVEGDVFINFKALINSTHDNINLHWITNLNMCIDHLGFEFVGQHIWATFTYHICAPIFVTRDIYGDVASVKWQCQKATT
jgi:hypothetical protein